MLIALSQKLSEKFAKAAHPATRSVPNSSVIPPSVPFAAAAASAPVPVAKQRSTKERKNRPNRSLIKPKRRKMKKEGHKHERNADHLFSAILVNNFVLSRFLGICPFLGVSNNLKTAMGMSGCYRRIGLGIGFHVADLHFSAGALGFGYLQTIVFILIIAALVQIIETILKKSIPSLYQALGIYLPLITTNCAILGVAILNIDEGYTFLQSLVNALGAGLGFMLALFLFAGVRSRLDKADIPQTLKGLPITLVAASRSRFLFSDLRA